MRVLLLPLLLLFPLLSTPAQAMPIYPPDIPDTALLSSAAPESQPGYLQTVRQTDYSTDLERITDPAMPVPSTPFTSATIIRHAYSERSAWTIDGSRFIVGDAINSSGVSIMPNGGLGATLDGVTYTGATQPTLSSELRLSNVTATKAYAIWYHDGSQNVAHFKSYDLSGTVLSDTPLPYPYADWLRGHGGISSDDGAAALVGASFDFENCATGCGTETVFVWNSATNSVTASLPGLPFTDQAHTKGLWNAYISNSGKRVSMCFQSDYPTATSGEAEWVFTVNSSTHTLTNGINVGPCSHMDWGTNASGQDMLVAFGGGGYQLGGFNAVTNTWTNLLPGISQIAMGHISCRNLKRWGWCYVSAAGTNPSTSYGYDQVYAVKLDGSGIVEPFGFMHNTASFSSQCGYPYGYLSEPQAVPSPDGSKVAFASDWNQSYTSSNDCPANQVRDYVAWYP